MAAKGAASEVAELPSNAPTAAVTTVVADGFSAVLVAMPGRAARGGLMGHSAKRLMCDIASGDELVNLLAVVKALDTPEHEVLAVVKERAVVRLSKTGVSTVDTLLPVESSCAMVLDAVTPPLAKLGKRGDSYLAGMYTGTDPLVVDDLMVPQIETVVLVTGARGNEVVP